MLERERGMCPQWPAEAALFGSITSKFVRVSLYHEFQSQQLL